MPSPLILSVLAATFGLTLAQAQCSRNSCYNALAYYCPTTASSDCASLLPTTTVTLRVTEPQAAVGFLITKTVTLTEAFGACLPESLATSVTTVLDRKVKRQGSIAGTTAVPSAPVSASKPCPQSSSPSPTHSTKVPGYAYRFGSCAPTAYASACSCLFGSSTITRVTVSVVSIRPTMIEGCEKSHALTKIQETHTPVATINDTTTAYVYTFLPNNCSAAAPFSSARPANSLSVSQAPRNPGTVSKSSSSASSSTSGSPSSSSQSRSTSSPTLSQLSASPSSSSVPATASSKTSSQTSSNSTSGSQPAITSSPTLSPTTSSSPQPSYTSCLTNRVVDILTDREHCGACNKTCAGSDLCINGICGTHLCAGKICGSFTVCGTGPPNGGCSCYTSNEGDGFCMDDQYCSDLKDCQSSADCGVTSICAVGTCCGRNVCMSAVCANPDAVLKKLARRVRLGKRAVGELLTNGQLAGRPGRIMSAEQPGQQ